MGSALETHLKTMEQSRWQLQMECVKRRLEEIEGKATIRI